MSKDSIVIAAGNQSRTNENLPDLAATAGAPPSISSKHLAGNLPTRRASEPSPIQTDKSIHFEVSAAQREIWLTQEMFPRNSLNFDEYTEIHGHVDQQTLANAISFVISETPALHTKFSIVDGEVKALKNKIIKSCFSFIDLADNEAAHSFALNFIREDVSKIRDIDGDELFEFFLIKIGQKNFIFYQRFHHIICDGHGSAMLAHRISTIYTALLNKELILSNDQISPSLVKKNGFDYRISKRYLSDRKFWMEYLSDFTHKGWLSRRRDSDTGEKLIKRSTYISAIESELIAHIAQKIGVPQSVIFITALAIYFRIVSGGPNLNFSIAVAGKGKNEYPSVGMESNIIPLILNVSSANKLADAVKIIRHELIKITRHRHYRGEDIRRDAHLNVSRWFGPIINIMDFDHGAPFHACQWKWGRISNSLADDLNISIYNRNDRSGFEIVFEDVESVHSSDDLAIHLKKFVSILTEITKNPEHSIAELEHKFLFEHDSVVGKSFFLKRRNFDGASVLQWKDEAINLLSLSNTLNFQEHHANPLALPKILIANHVLSFDRLDILKQCSEYPPGTLIKIHKNSWQISTATQDVRVGHFINLFGEFIDGEKIAFDLGLYEGSRLPILSDEINENIKRHQQLVNKNQEYWLDRLERFQPFNFPFEVDNSKKTGDNWGISGWNNIEALESIDKKERYRYVISIWWIYLFRITGKSSFQIGWAVDPVMPAILAGIFSETVPIQPAPCRGA
jgi:hypothetical protein